MLSLPLSWVERALLRTLSAGVNRFSIFSQLPSSEGWREGEVLGRLHAVASRRGGFGFLIHNTALVPEKLRQPSENGALNTDRL